MQKIYLFLLLCFTALATGCPKSAPVRPEAVEKVAQYEIEQLENNIVGYECAYFGSTINVSESIKGKGYTNRTITCANGTTTDLAKAKRLRDATIQRLIRVIDYNYFQFENDLYVRRTTGSFLADAIDMGGNLAGTITNGERAKTIINAALIAFRGTRKSGSIHYFQEQTADVLITKMQTSRNRVLAEMLRQLKDQDVDSYTLDAALGDTIRYFYAGTLPRALQELKIDTSLLANEAREEVREIKGLLPSPPVTKEEEELAQSSIVTLVRLQKALRIPETAETTKITIQAIVARLEEDKELKKILDDNKITSSSAGQAILEALVSIRSNARTFQKFEELNKINRIITEVGAEGKN